MNTMIDPCMVTSARYCSGVIMPPGVNGSFRFGQTRWMRISSESAMPTNTEKSARQVVLNADDLVIEAEDILANETARRVVMSAALVCHHRVAPRTFRLPLGRPTAAAMPSS